MLSKPWRFTLVVTAIFLAAALVACGGGSDDEDPVTTTTADSTDDEQIRAVVAQYSDAVIADDPTALCEVLSPADVKQSGGGGIEECAVANDTSDNILFSAPENPLVVTEVVFDPKDKTIARAEVEGDNFVTLAKRNGEWAITFGAELTKQK